MQLGAGLMRAGSGVAPLLTKNGPGVGGRGPRSASRLLLNWSSASQSRFVEPMLLLRTEKLPDGPAWLHELKLDGYRALAIKTDGSVRLRSRNDNDFTGRYPGIVKALAAMPDETVIDGEVVA